MYNTSIKNPIHVPFPISKKELEILYIVEEKNLEEIGKQINRSRQCVARWMEFWKIKRRSGIVASKLKRRQKNLLRGPNWQGGKWFVKQSQTWFVYTPDHPRRKANGGVEEHRLIAEKMIDRYLNSDELIHHKDGDHLNNSSSNLCIMTKSTHQRVHRILGEIGIKLINDGQIDLIFNKISADEDKQLIDKVYIKNELIVK